MSHDEDEDDTQRRQSARARSHWDADQRALVSRRTRTPVHGVVANKDDAEDTSPIETILGEPDIEDIEALRRAHRDSEAPVKQIDLAKTLRYVKRKLFELSEREKSNNEQRADQLLELLQRAPDAAVQHLTKAVQHLTARVTDAENRAAAADAKATKAEETITASRRIAAAAITLALGAVVSVVFRIWDRAESEGAARARFQYIENEVNRLRDRQPPADRHWQMPPQFKDIP